MNLDTLLERNSREETDALTPYPTQHVWSREELDRLTWHANQVAGCEKRPKAPR